MPAEVPVPEPVADQAPPEAPPAPPSNANEPVTRSEFEDLKQQNAELREVIRQMLKQKSEGREGGEDPEVLFFKSENEHLKKELEGYQPIRGAAYVEVEEKVENKYGGGDYEVRTQKGKLKIGGLLQVWFYSIQNDNMGWVDADEVPTPVAGFSSNEVQDNDSFRVRRAQLRFDMELNEYFSAHVMFDPAREATSFPNFPSNQGTGYSGESDVHYNPGLAIGDDGTGAFTAMPIGNTRNAAVRTGAGEAGRLLQDAYINLHGLAPHHDFSAGQMRRRIGEEGSRNPEELDFAERAMITQPASVRDLGAMIHGSWWDERVQYWFGAFNGAGQAFERRYNRADDNDAKDLLATLMVRPIWGQAFWGSLELGASLLYGQAGEAGARNFDIPSTLDGLNRGEYARTMHYAWLHYRPVGYLSGMWVRGEYGRIRDRFEQNTLLTLPGTTNMLPHAFSLEGWYAAVGYKFAESVWGARLREGGYFEKHVLEPLEFVARYERMRNLLYQDVVFPDRRLDDFHTDVITLGLNYYVQGHNAKFQLNYNIVNEQDKIDTDIGLRQGREVKNNNLILSFQLSW
ncbi:MAG: OprO/OprP family phosphate-selective porin [Planctomycetota bacterium]|nr:OprO/OprP family phosphate-selective porin [Planctomycetota bacterium]